MCHSRAALLMFISCVVLVSCDNKNYVINNSTSNNNNNNNSINNNNHNLHQFNPKHRNRHHNVKRHNQLNKNIQHVDNNNNNNNITSNKNFLTNNNNNDNINNKHLITPLILYQTKQQQNYNQSLTSKTTNNNNNINHRHLFLNPNTNNNINYNMNNYNNYYNNKFNDDVNNIYNNNINNNNNVDNNINNNNINNNVNNNNNNNNNNNKNINNNNNNDDDNNNINNDNCVVSRLHKGCSCSRYNDNFSINCSAVGLVGIPKQWMEVGLTSNLITTLNLEKNNIEILDSDFYGLNIQRLLLANNSISELRPLSFWGLGNSLETLDLSYNKLRKVPNEALKLLIKLKTLVLTGNAIQSIGPHELGFMKSLEVLTLDKNPITSIHPSFISGSNNLNLLSLDAIKLDKKLESVAAIHANNVKGLSLTRNHLTLLPPRWGVNFTLLTLLNLGHNRLGDVIKMEDCFVGMERSLKNLDLHSNHFLKIPSKALKTLSVLTTLDLSHNKIRKVKRRSLRGLQALASLDLSHNKIKEIGKKAFVGLESLYKLDLRFNHLFSLDERTFRGLTSHNLASSQQNNFASPRQMQVYISNNPWLCNCLLAWVKRSILQSQNGKLLSDLTSGGQRRKRKNFFDERYPIGYKADNSDVTSHNLYPHNKHDVKLNNILDIFADTPICHRPSLIKGLPLSKVNDNDLHCNHDYYYYADDDDAGATTATTTTAKMGLSRVSNNSLTK